MNSYLRFLTIFLSMIFGFAISFILGGIFTLLLPIFVLIGGVYIGSSIADNVFYEYNKPNEKIIDADFIEINEYES